jgi:hypothetical protein
MPPGPGLSATLATVERDGLTAAELAALAAAWARQIAYDQAGLLADSVALAAIPWDGPGPAEQDLADDFAADQVAARECSGPTVNLSAPSGTHHV